MPPRPGFVLLVAAVSNRRIYSPRFFRPVEGLPSIILTTPSPRLHRIYRKLILRPRCQRMGPSPIFAFENGGGRRGRRRLGWVNVDGPLYHPRTGDLQASTIIFDSIHLADLVKIGTRRGRLIGFCIDMDGFVVRNHPPHNDDIQGFRQSGKGGARNGRFPLLHHAIPWERRRRDHPRYSSGPSILECGDDHQRHCRPNQSAQHIDPVVVQPGPAAA